MEGIMKNGERKKTEEIMLGRIVDNNEYAIKDGKIKSVNVFCGTTNCEMFTVEFWLEQLNAKQIAQEVEQFKSADGQYVFAGTFMCREYIEVWVKDNKRVLNAEFNYVEVRNGQRKRD